MYGGIGDDEPYYNDIIEDYNIFNNSCNNNSNNADNSNSSIDEHLNDDSWPSLQIEEITNDSCDEQSLLTNNASAALCRPAPHSIIY